MSFLAVIVLVGASNAPHLQLLAETYLKRAWQKGHTQDGNKGFRDWHASCYMKEQKAGKKNEKILH